MTWFNVNEEKQFELETAFAHINNSMSDDFHKQATPFKLCVEMVEKIGADEEKDWLVIANLEFLIVLRKYFEAKGWNFEDKVSYATPCESKAEFARYIGVKNIVKYSYENFKDSWDMSRKFDFIVGNPPYKGEIHMNMLEKAYEILSDNGQLIFVQPSCYVFTFRTSKFDFFDNLKQHIAYVKIFNGNVVFKNAKFFSPLMITHFIKNEIFNSIKVAFPTSIEEFKLTHQLNIFGSNLSIESFFNKLSQYDNYILGKTCWTRFESLDKVPKEGYVLWFSGIRGNVSSNSTNELFMTDFFTIVQRKREAHILKVSDFLEDKKGSGYAFHFSTVQEAQNMYKYLTTNFARRALSFIKNDQNINLRLIPWVDFTQEWTDEKLFKHFDLTQEEIKFINEIPQYY